jgi:site-specific recombinase
MAECRACVEEVLHKLEHQGVSVDVVYRIEVIQKNLDRIWSLLPLLEPATPEARARAGVRVLARLMRAKIRDRSLRDLVRTNTHLLARKIIERAGETGEHYITATRAQWFKMLVSAGGGGVLTVGTAALKFLTKWQHYPLFVDGMASAINYAGSFLLMQLLGFTLATKQPSMTAAALAGALSEASARDQNDQHSLDAMVVMIARTCRSQLAAAIGNVGLAIPSAIGFDLLWQQRTGEHFLDQASALAVVQSFHPTESGTVFYAALTGVVLWLSSVGAGWLENWATYRRLPEAIADHRIQRVVGGRTTRWLARAFARNVSGFGGNVTLGFLLGMTPVAGKFFGLPLDVRHVTLSTCGLALAGCALPGTSDIGFEAAMLGIALIGMLNFGVSFMLALLVALRARDVGWRERVRLARAVLSHLVRRPLDFVFPSRGETAPAGH